MNIFLSLILLFLLVGAAAWKIFRANRLAAASAREREMERKRKEREIMARLETLRKKDDLDFARGAIDKDPERAAKVVSRMLKKGGMR